MSALFLWKNWRNIVEIKRIVQFFGDKNAYLQHGNTCFRYKSSLKIKVDNKVPSVQFKKITKNKVLIRKYK